MTKKLSIVFLALGLVSCGSLPPLDDAYIWPDKKAEQAAQTTQTVPDETPAEDKKAEQAAQVATTEPVHQSVSATQEQRPAAPTMEIISQKDTTITVRIKK